MTSWRYRLNHWSDRLAALGWRSTLATVAVVGAFFVLVGTALIIARGDAAEAIAKEARILTWSESVGSSAAVLRGEVRESLVIGQSLSFGVFDATAVSSAATRVREAVDELGLRVDGLGQLVEDSRLTAAATEVTRFGLAVADSLDTADIEQALADAQDGLGPALESLTLRTTAISEEAADEIAAVTAGLGTITTSARFVSALLIPVLAVFLLYRALRKSQKVSVLRTELSRERELRRKKDAFIAAASHHIRTPLSAVVGFAELLRDRTRDFNAGVRNEVTELLAMEAEETANVVDDLLAAARYDLGELQLDEAEIELRELLDHVTSDWAYKERMRLTIRGNAFVVGDKRWLGHALRNLLRNAVSFGGEQIRVNIHTVLNKVIIEVSDNGEPIPEGEHERIFELYYSYRQIEGLAPSLGLGLSVARRIVRAMGGDLGYYRLDGMNVFEMKLPAPNSLPAATNIADRTIDPGEGMPTLDSITSVIATGGPRIEFQPIVDLGARSRGDHAIVGYEALARFMSQPPPVWFNAAATIGLRVELELSCISAAIRSFDPPEDRTFLAVNLSDRTLHTSRLDDAVAELDPTRLVLELSETASIKSYEETKRVLDALAARGVRLAVDDVGSGDVDLWHMARLGAEIIKVDMSLVRELHSSPRNRALIRGITAMADELGALVVAEGVESESEHSLLSELGVRFGQGYLYGKPAELTGLGSGKLT